MSVVWNVHISTTSTLPLFSAQLKSAQEEQHSSVKVGLLLEMILTANACTVPRYCIMLSCCFTVIYVLHCMYIHTYVHMYVGTYVHVDQEYITF